MKNIIILLLAMTSQLCYGQTSFTDQEIKQKTDSILQEGTKLYQFERAAWVSTDLFHERGDLKEVAVNYLVYQTNDTVRTIFYDKAKKQSVIEYFFYKTFDAPVLTRKHIRELTFKENQLIDARNKIIEQIIKEKYPVGAPQGYTLNNQIIPNGKEFKLYFVTGTSQNNIIPLGNDYIFHADESAKILSWKRFHSRLLPLPSKGEDGSAVKGLIHSHLVAEPFISATDICTFKLYGQLYGLKNFSVLSTALSKIFTFDIDENKIEVKNR
ncbi:hypothetical protein [Parabacteroides sp. FAFU027]|uniref:hypothetical protein n=1 Tax=Parabacteroides sp. FAFU027 TaxID=2922715 RepID=UPI001FAFCB49|nr:hypothetical protein [Parabacteroides sp. FAFU027]